MSPYYALSRKIIIHRHFFVRFFRPIAIYLDGPALRLQVIEEPSG